MTQPANQPGGEAVAEVASTQALHTLRAENTALRAENAALREIIAKQNELIATLQARIAELERRVGLDSSNRDRKSVV